MHNRKFRCFSRTLCEKSSPRNSMKVTVDDGERTQRIKSPMAAIYVVVCCLPPIRWKSKRIMKTPHLPKVSLSRGRNDWNYWSHSWWIKMSPNKTFVWWNRPLHRSTTWPERYLYNPSGVFARISMSSILSKPESTSKTLLLDSLQLYWCWMPFRCCRNNR